MGEEYGKKQTSGADSGKIVDVSAELFAKKGYEQTSIQDILDATGLSKGGLYHHFKSKEEILEAVMQKRVQYVNGRFHNIIRNTEETNAKEKLKKYFISWQVIWKPIRLIRQ